MEVFGVPLWALITLIISLVVNILLLSAVTSIRKRAEQLGLPVKGKDKVGVMTILLGKSISMKYTPTIDNNTVEIELDKKKGVKGVWAVEDLYTKPIKGLYGMSAAILTYDIAHALDAEIEHELATVENLNAPEEAKQHFKEMIERLLVLYRQEVYYESLLKKLEERNEEGSSKYTELLEKLIKVKKEIEELEQELSKIPLVSKLKKGEAFVFTAEDGTAYIVRQLNIERIKRYAKALSPVTLWSSIKAYYETLKGDRSEFYKSVFSLAVLAMVVGLVIAIIIAAAHSGGSINAHDLAKAIAEASKNNQQNVTKVVVG